MKSRSKKLLIYKLLAFGFTVLLFLMPSNISALPDNDLRVIVTTLALDFAENKFEAHALVFVPNKNGGETAAAVGKGDSAPAAIANMQTTLGRKTELGQCELLAIGDGLAAKGIKEPMGFLLSSSLIGSGSAVIYIKSAKDFIESAGKIASNISSGLNSFVMYTRNQIYVPSISLVECLSTIKTTGSTYLPEVLLKKEEGDKASIKKISNAVIIKDDKLFQTLDEENSRGISWLDKRSQRGIVEVKDFSFDGVAYGAVSSDLKHKTVNKNAEFVNGVPIIKIKINMHLALDDGSIITSNNGVNKQLLKALTQSYQDTVKAEIDASITALKAGSADFLAIRETFYRHQNKQLKKFEEEGNDFYSALKVEYDINCRVK